jgi:hypothetical protein
MLASAAALDEFLQATLTSVPALLVVPDWMSEQLTPEVRELTCA